MSLHCPCVVWEIEGGEENVVKGVAELSFQMKINVGIETFSFPLPGHSTIDGKVKGVGEANEGINNQNNIFGNIVIHEVESETNINLKS